MAKSRVCPSGGRESGGRDRWWVSRSCAEAEGTIVARAQEGATLLGGGPRGRRALRAGQRLPEATSSGPVREKGTSTCGCCAGRQGRGPEQSCSTERDGMSLQARAVPRNFPC